MGEHESILRLANVQQRATFVRHQLEEHDMPVADAPDDDDVRQTYNFAPGYHGLVYRADVPDYGAGNRHRDREDATEGAAEESEEAPSQLEDVKETRYKIQAMKWGVCTPSNSRSSELKRKAHHGRPGSILDEAQSRLRFRHEDYQRSRRFAEGESRHVEHHEKDQAMHCGSPRLL